MHLKLVVAAVALLMAAATPAFADQQQDFIISKLAEQYRAYQRQVGNDASKKAKLTAIYKKTLKAIQLKPGLGGLSAAHAGNDEMRKSFNELRSDFATSYKVSFENQEY